MINYDPFSPSAWEFIQSRLGTPSEKTATDVPTRYDPPWAFDLLPPYLQNDPVHAWRGKEGIELIHREPDLKELLRIWANWQLMSKSLKRKSEKKSKELFGLTNAEHMEQLRPLYSEEKTASAAWASKLLRKPTSKLIDLVKSRYPKTVNETLPDSRVFAADNKLNEKFVDPITRQSALRVLRGDYPDMNSAMTDLAAKQRLRSTIRATDIGNVQRTVDVPYNTQTTGFRGFSNGTHGEHQGQEWLSNGTLMSSGNPNVRSSYASRPEFAAIYADIINPPRLVKSKYPTGAPPLATDQKFVGQVNLDDINPVTEHVIKRLPDGTPVKGLLYPPKGFRPWAAANKNFPYEDRDIVQQTRMIQEAMKRSPQGLPLDYELRGNGSGVPLQKLFRVTGPPPGPLSRMSPQAQTRFDHARWMKENLGESASPNAGLVETRLLEDPADTARRSLSFFNRYSE
jgi:hypothetical protein